MSDTVTKVREGLERYLTLTAQQRGCSENAAKDAAKAMMQGAEIGATGAIALRIDGKPFDADTLDEGVDHFLAARSYFRDAQRPQEAPAAGGGSAAPAGTVKSAIEALAELRGGGVPTSQEFFAAGLNAPLPQEQAAAPALPDDWKTRGGNEMFALAGFDGRKPGGQGQRG